jgi:hypothetical protein
MAFSMARQNPIESHTTLAMLKDNKHTIAKHKAFLWLPTGGPWARAYSCSLRRSASHGRQQMTIYLGTKLHRSIVETLEQLFLLIDPSDLAAVLCEIGEPHPTANHIAGALSEFGDIEPESWRGDDIRSESISIDSFEGMTFSEMRQLVVDIAIAKEMKPKLKIELLGRIPFSEFFQSINEKAKAKAKETTNVIQFPDRS